MTDDELERSLLSYYRAMDPKRAPERLGMLVARGLDSRPARPVVLVRARPAFAAAVAAVLIVAVGLGLRPGGYLSSPGASATATSTPATSATTSTSPRPGTPTPSALSSVTGPVATPTIPSPSGSVPPLSTTVWSSLLLQPLAGGPVGVTSVADWSGGYVALGRQSYPDSLPAWISRDSRTWVALPAGIFGAPVAAIAAPCADGVVVATQSYEGQTIVWHSTDGTAWTSRDADPMLLNRDKDLAGNSTGAVAILENTPNRIAFSADGLTWQTVSLPGDSTASVQGVAAFGPGFVAVGEAGTQPISPAAWWSTDGLHWTRATVQADPGNFLMDVHAGSSGLIALGHDQGTPGTTSFWTSPDGRSWKISTADPLGNSTFGVGSGANGLFAGDGVRLLGYGNRTETGPTEYWISLDGAHWKRLALAGDAAAAGASGGGVTPFLMRDGILFSSSLQSWFGAP